MEDTRISSDRLDNQQKSHQNRGPTTRDPILSLGSIRDINGRLLMADIVLYDLGSRRYLERVALNPNHRIPQENYNVLAVALKSRNNRTCHIDFFPPLCYLGEQPCSLKAKSRVAGPDCLNQANFRRMPLTMQRIC